MFKPSLCCLRAALVTVVSAGVGSLSRAQSPQLPPGAIAPKVTTACTECHESRIIAQQRLTKAAWRQEALGWFKLTGCVAVAV
jgi:hypothetical protein